MQIWQKIPGENKLRHKPLTAYPLPLPNIPCHEGEWPEGDLIEGRDFVIGPDWLAVLNNQQGQTITTDRGANANNTTERRALTEKFREQKKHEPKEPVYQLTGKQIRELWESACKTVLQDVSLTFLNPYNLDKAALPDRAVFRAIGESIQKFPIPEANLYCKEQLNIEL